MRLLSKREQAAATLFKFVGVDYATLQITQTGLDKGYTDATVPFRGFLKRTGIHDFALQEAGEQFIKYVDIFGLTKSGPELLKISFQRPATKNGRMFRVSMLGGLKNPLRIKPADVLIFFVNENQLHLGNLTQLTDRIAEVEPIPSITKNPRETNTLTIVKNRILYVMEGMPECESATGTGATCHEISDLSGMLLQKKPTALVNVVLDELCFENRIELAMKNPRKYRLCH